MWLEEVERLLAAAPARRHPGAGELAPSAVLVPLYVAGGALWVVLTRRSDAVSQHAGQYSFPGGARAPEDEDDVATALREAAEEIGIDSAAVVVLGRLDDQRTPTGYVVAPVVGALPFPVEFRPAPREVDQVVPIPFAYLANPVAVELEELALGDEVIASPVFHYHGHRIWGATARILADLVERISGTAAAPEG